MVDDLGAIDDRILDRLPNIKSLFINDGLRFNAAYSETPLCCPGRASFLTGQHTRRNGVVQNDARLLDPSHTIATTLHEAGYYTMMIGKYLNGAAQLTDHTPPGWDEVAMLNDWSSNLSSDWWVQDQPVVAGYFDRFIGEQAASWLTAAPADQPVFMWVAPHAPHKSASTTSDWEPDIEPQYVGDSRCSGIPPWHPPNYLFAGEPDGYPLDDICRSLLTVDDMVGNLRDIVSAENRNPIWVFTSDNGMAWGADGYLLKNVPQADKVPLYFAGPSVVEGRTDALVSNIDVSPTLASAAGTTMSFADGKSFLGVLHGDGGGRKAMLEDHPVGGPTGEGDVATGPWWGVRTPHWHLIVWNGIQLYDLDADPWEMTDVAAEHPDVVKQLEGHLGPPDPIADAGSDADAIAHADPTDSPPQTPTAVPSQTVAPSGSADRRAPRPTSPALATPAPSAGKTPRQGKGATSNPTTAPDTAAVGSTDTSTGATSAVVVWLLVIAFAIFAGVLLGRHMRPRASPSK